MVLISRRYGGAVPVVAILSVIFMGEIKHSSELVTSQNLEISLATLFIFLQLTIISLILQKFDTKTINQKSEDRSYIVGGLDSFFFINLGVWKNISLVVAAIYGLKHFFQA